MSVGKKIRVGLVFEYDPSGSHDWLFDGLTDSECLELAKRLGVEDVLYAVDNDDVVRQLFVEIEGGN